jgi:hypothetical protein
MLITPPPNSDNLVTDPPRLSPLGIAVVCFSLLNLLGMPLGAAIGRGGGEGAFWLIAIGMGGIVAQFGVLPAWLVWGDRSHWPRLLLHWGLATLLYGCWVLGMMIVIADPEFIRFALTVFLFLPVISLGIEAPLWLTRLVFGWRFRRPAEAGHERPLAIRDFLSGMAVISVALAAVRIASALANGPGTNEVWIPLAIGATAGTLTSAVVLLPLAWCVLRIQDVVQMTWLVVVYVGVASVIVMLIMFWLGGLSANAEEVIAIFLIVGSTVAAIAFAFWLARSAGFRLEVGKPRVEQDEPT